MIARRRVILGIAAAAAATTLRGRALAGPVTIDEIGDQVQTLPKGQLPDFASPTLPRRAYGLRHEEYLRLKILTCILPPL